MSDRIFILEGEEIGDYGDQYERRTVLLAAADNPEALHQLWASYPIDHKRDGYQFRKVGDDLLIDYSIIEVPVLVTP